jgi:4-amino-4-deoxy-L-arabinose transferase-like glycosyltransferase
MKKLGKSQALMSVLVFAIALTTRLFWLDKVPNGMTNDELHYVLNAKAVYFGFTDMSGSWSPLSLKTIPDNPSAELTFPILAPFVGPFELNTFTARLPFAVMSSLLAVILALIAWEISPLAGWIAGLVTIINPWTFYNGRIAFDQPMATFFLMLTMLLLLRLRSRWVLLSTVTAFLGFFTYIGTKVIFAPFMAGIIAFSYYKNQKKYLGQYLSVLAVVLMITGYFVFNTITGPSRVNELVTPYSNLMTIRAELERSQSVENFSNKFFINRYTEYLAHFSRKYLNSFSPDVLFNKGDETYLMSLWKQGYFYYFDLVFLIIGGYFLFREKRRYFWLILGLLALAPIPEAIRADNIPAYAFHSCLQYPLLILVVSAGILKIVSLYPKLALPIGAVYLISFLRLTNLYFFRYPIYQPDGFFFSNRVISRWIELERQNNQKVVVVTNEPSNYFRQYLFYTNQYTKENFENIKKLYNFNRNDITFNNIRFTDNSKDELKQNDVVYISQTNFKRLDQPRLATKQQTSALENFSILNSSVCDAKKLSFEKPRLSLQDFEVEKMPKEEFCAKYAFQM